jgi:hypothetical protein
MPETTPPKGRPTPGRRDRSVAKHRRASRRRIIRYAWAVLAAAVLIALLVLGTGSGGNGTTTNFVGLLRPALA